MRRRSAQGITVSLLLAAWAATVSAQGAPLIRNLHPGIGRESPISVSGPPLAVVGNQAGTAYELDRVVGFAKLSDGRLVVADGGSVSLRFFDARGTFLKAVGGRGEGPGMFERLMFLTVLPGDTLVGGSVTGDLSYFGGDGSFIARHGVHNPPLPIAATGRPFNIAILDGRGTRLVGAAPRPVVRPPGGTWVDSTALSFVDGANREVKGLGRFPFMEMAERNGQPKAVWLGASAVFAAGNGLVYIGFGSEYAIRVFDRRGVLQYVIQRDWTPERISTRIIESFVREWGRRWITVTGPQADAQLKALREDAYAKVLPAFSQFIPDRIGRLWVRAPNWQDAAASGALNLLPIVPSEWSVFDRSGRWVAEVIMPAGFRPTDIGTDYVAGVASDADGVQTAVVYRLAGIRGE